MVRLATFFGDDAGGEMIGGRLFPEGVAFARVVVLKTPV